jgi:hypothetical protein
VHSRLPEPSFSLLSAGKRYAAAAHIKLPHLTRAFPFNSERLSRPSPEKGDRLSQRVIFPENDRPFVQKEANFFP